MYIVRGNRVYMNTKRKILFRVTIFSFITTMILVGLNKFFKPTFGG